MLEMTLVGRRFANGGSNPSVRRKGCNGRTSGGLERVTYKRYAALGRLQFKTAQGEVSSLPDVSSHLSNRWVPGDDDPKQDRRDEHGDDHCNQGVKVEQHCACVGENRLSGQANRSSRRFQHRSLAGLGRFFNEMRQR